MKKVVVIVVAVLVLGVGGYLAFAKKDKSSGTPETPPPASETSDAGSATSASDPCALVPKADAESAFGLTFKDAVTEGDATGTSRSCIYEEQNDGSPTGMNQAMGFTITAESYATSEEARTALETIRNNEKIGDQVFFVRTDVPAVGEEAFFYQAQVPAVLETEEFLYARKGSQIYNFIAVRLDGIDHDKAKQQLTQAAKKALN